MRFKILRRPTLALSTVAAAVGLSLASPVAANAVTRTGPPVVSVAPVSDPSVATQAIEVGSIDIGDCTYTLVLDWDGLHVEVVCVTIS